MTGCNFSHGGRYYDKSLPPEDVIYRFRANRFAQAEAKSKREMNGYGTTENKRQRNDYWQAPPEVMSPYRVSTTTSRLCADRDEAIRERDEAIRERDKALFAETIALFQRSMEIADHARVKRERDDAIAALQLHESSENVLLEDCSSSGPPKRTSNSKSVHTTNAVNGNVTKESTDKAKRPSSELNSRVTGLTTDVSKAVWNTNVFRSITLIQFDESKMPVPVCSCTGVHRRCHKWADSSWGWGVWGWESACCTRSMSAYPLPSPHVRISARRMCGDAFNGLLSRLAAQGHDLLSDPVDLKSYWG